jgi:hypothetical protein
MVRLEIEGVCEQGLRIKCGHKSREVAGGWISYMPTKYIRWENFTIKLE